MNENPRPLPAHGTYARANGSPGYREPCKCDPCVLKMRAKRKQQKINRQLGRPARMDASQARNRLLKLNKTMGWNDIAAAAGCSHRHLYLIATGKVPQINRGTHNKIMAARQGVSGGIYIDPTGSIRRVRALQAIGHTLKTIAETAGSAESRIQPLAAGCPLMRRKLADKVARAYKVLADKPGSSTRSKNRAAAAAWAPPGAWDDDTIDDPTAHPEWTGHCGTDHGWWLHRVQKLPGCQRCAEAHQQWLDDLGDVTPAERIKALRVARSAACNRGMAIADDARELMRISGLTYDQAAERLGITRQHLQQELSRHPKQMEMAA
ncbi:hypothetical protein ACFY97_18455 [Streptomyces klenkii]|uniref:hypothetical protein n=1 Tax=Streptomyces klenkii TaxID=1420899 RepID=UPI0036E4ACF3